jgi:DHA1 family inner membrane transport protein
MLCQSMQALAFGGIALFLPLIRTDLGLTFTQAGSLSAAATLVYAAMQIPSGYLADRLGPKRLFIIGLAGTNLLTLVFARLHTYWALVANQAVTGFFRALVFAPGLLLITALFPPQRRATAMGLYIAGGFSSNILLNAIGPALVDPLGWRTLFTAFAIGGLLMLLLFWRFGSEGPDRAGASPLQIREALHLFRFRVMWVIALIQFVRLAVVFGLAFWLPTFIVDDRGYSLKIAGLAVAIGGVLTALSNFVGGYVSDRLRNPLLVIGTSLAVLAVTTSLLVHVHDLVPLIVVVAANAFFVQLYFGPLFALPVELLGPRTAGSASGFGNFFANLGGFTFTYTLGALKDATGSFAVGFYSLAVLCVIALLGTIVLSRMRVERPAW